MFSKFIIKKKLKLKLSRVLKSSLQFFFSVFLVWYKLKHKHPGEEGGAWLLVMLETDSGLAQYISISKKGVDAHCVDNLFC